MKKGLFLLPLLGGFVLAGCQFTVGNKTIKLFEKDKTEEKKDEKSGGGSGTGGGTGGGGSQSGGGTGGGGSVSGTPFATVTLKGCKDAADTSARPLVFSNGGASVSIGQSNATTDMAQAIANTKTYEFRIYKGMSVEFSADKSFSKLVISYSTWKESSGTTYYFDFDFDGATNEHDDAKGEAVVTLDDAATSFSIGDVSHQTRVASVAFYA